MHMRMRTFTRLTSFTYFHVTSFSWPELSMSERERQLARLCKQRQRSCMKPDVQRQEARRHQHASRAAENEQRR